MNLSDVLYEAACRVSIGNDERYSYEYSCPTVWLIGGIIARKKYAWMMGLSHVFSFLYVENAAEEVGWTTKDFRTFMLLMASEAANVDK